MRTLDTSKVRPAQDTAPVILYRVFVVHKDGSRVHNTDYMTDLYARHQAGHILAQYQRRREDEGEPSDPSRQIDRVEVYKTRLEPVASSLASAWAPPRKRPRAGK